MNLSEITGKSKEELEEEGILWIDDSTADVGRFVDIGKLIYCEEPEFKNASEVIDNNLQKWTQRSIRYNDLINNGKIKDAKQVVKSWTAKTKEDHRFPLGFAKERTKGRSSGDSKNQKILQSLAMFFEDTSMWMEANQEVRALSVEFITFPIEGVGNDIISDLVLKMLVDKFAQYTDRKIKELNIEKNIKIINGLKMPYDKNGKVFFLIPQEITTNLKVNWNMINDIAHSYKNLNFIAEKIDNIKDEAIKKIKDIGDSSVKLKESDFKSNKELVKLIINPNVINAFSRGIMWRRFLIDNNKNNPFVKSDGQYIQDLKEKFPEVNARIKDLLMDIIEHKSAEFVYNQDTNNLCEQNLQSLITLPLIHIYKNKVEYEKVWGDGRADIILNDTVIELKVINKNEVIDVKQILISQLRTYMNRFKKTKGILIIAYQNLKRDTLEKIKKDLEINLKENEDYFLIGFGYNITPSEATIYQPTTRLIDSSMTIDQNNLFSNEEYIEHKTLTEEYIKIMGRRKNVSLEDLKVSLDAAIKDRNYLFNELKKYITIEKIDEFKNLTNSKLKEKLKKFKITKAASEIKDYIVVND